MNAPASSRLVDWLCPAVALFLVPSLFAGSYSQNFDVTPADGSAFASNNSSASLTGGQLKLTSATIGGSVAGFRVPDLDPGRELVEFTVDYDVTLYLSSGTPADGYSVNFGAISSNNADLIGGQNGLPEEGMTMANGLSVCFDTYDNGGGEACSIDAKANGSTVRGVYMESGSSPGGAWTRAGGSYPFDNVKRHVTIHWELNTGLDVTITGSNGSPAVVMTDVPTPGFVTSQGNVFAWGARTGGAMEDMIMDNVVITTVPSVPITTGGPVISEFLADNGGSLLDENCDSGPWIEIYNGQATAQNMAGWFLTDDAAVPNKWALPAGLTIQPYQYQIVWADSKNRTTAPNYHTNFTLSKTGGYVGLVNAASTVVSSYSFAPQSKNISYGTLGVAQTAGFLAVPTPGVKNSGIQSDGPPIAEEPVFSRVGGLVTSAFTLTMDPPVTAGAVARYTTDNTAPNTSSPVWPVGGLPISVSSTIRARYFPAVGLGGPVVSRSFTFLDSTLTNYNGTGQPFSSNLPIIVLNSFGTDIDNAGGSPGLRPFRSIYAVTLNTEAVNGNKAVITGPVDMQNRCGVHVRGETSAGFPQRPYAWEIWDNEEKDKPVSIFGWPAESDFVLISNYNDKSLVRNMMPFETMRRLRGDGSAMKEKYVEVFFKQNGSGPLAWSDYRGIYVLTEKIKRDKDRVNIDELRTCDGVFANNPAVDDAGIISGGYIIRKDKASPEPNFTTNGGTAAGVTYAAQNLQMVEPNAPSADQLNYIKGYMNRFEAALYGTTFADPVNGYAKYIDVDSFIDVHLWVEMFKQIDGYRLSTYFTKDRAGKLKALPIWDYNLCIGNGSPAGGYAATLEQPTEWYYAQLGNDANPYHPRLFQDPLFLRRYWDRYWELRRTMFSNASMMAAIDGYASQLRAGVTTGTVTNGTGAWPSTVVSLDVPIGRHNARWQRLGQYDWPNATGTALRTAWDGAFDPATVTASTDPFATTSEISFVKTWLIRRLLWMDGMSMSYAGSVKNFKPPVLNSYGGTVNSGFTLSVTDPNATAGTIYYTTDGTDPALGGGQVFSGVVLVSETGPVSYLVPSTTNGGSALSRAQLSGVAAPPNAANWLNGTLGLGYDYNDPSATPANDVLFGPYIGTNVKSVMQPGTAAPPNNASIYLRLPFTLTQGDIDSFTTLKLLVRYDDSYIAYLNGTEIARKSYNVASTPAYNTASGITHADALAIVFEDAAINAYKNLLVPGNNMLAFHAMNASASITSASGKDFLIQPRLEAGVAASLVVNQTMQFRARILDAGGTWSPLTTSDLVVNAVPASASNVVVSEINYNPAAPTAAETAASGANNANDFEFLEIMNISNQTVDLTDCQIDAGVTFLWSSAPLNRRLLAPGARLVLVENPAAFASRYGSSPGIVVGGAFSGNLANGGEALRMLAANGSVIRSFTYDDVEPWPVDADLDLNASGQVVRGGYTLVLNNPLANLDHNNGRNWHSSVTLGGSPGAADLSAFSGTNTGDTDNDGVSDLVEFAVGSSSSSGTQIRLPAVSHGTFTVGGIAQTCLSVAITRNLAANVSVVPQVSASLAAWDDGGVALTYVSTQNNGDGTATEIWRSTQPVSALPDRLFVRTWISSN